MTCRHGVGDPNCGSTPKGRSWADAYANTPDVDNYEIEEIERVGSHLVLKVKYPNCAACAYEGDKVMVFLNVGEKDVLRWRKIDPHFRDPQPRTGRSPKEAPSPAARFPASKEGWADALVFAQGKAR